MHIPKVAMPPLWGQLPKERKGGFKPIALCALEYLGPLPASRSLLCWQQGLGPEIFWAYNEIRNFSWKTPELGVREQGTVEEKGREGGERRKVSSGAMYKAKTASPIVLPLPQQRGLELLLSLLSKKYRMWRKAPVFPWGQSNHHLWRKDIAPINTAQDAALYKIKILVLQTRHFGLFSEPSFPFRRHHCH